MLKPIFIVSIIVSTFYLLPMSTNKKEIFLNLVKEFQKLKNLAAKHPELQADFNAIANPNKVQKIEEFLAKEKAKIMAKRDAENDMKSETIMEDEKTKLDFSTFQDELILWKTNQLEGFYLIKNKNKEISKSTLSLHIGAKKERVEGCTLLSNMYSAFEGKLSKEQISIEDIIAGFKAVFNEYDFTDTKAMKAWFKDKASNEWYEKEKKKSFKDNLLDLAEAINVAQKDLAEAINVAQKENSSLINFQNWYNQNKKSLQVLGKDSIGYISLEKLCNRVTNCYGGILGCEFIPSYLLNGIDKTITKTAPKDIIMRLDANLDNFYYNASHTQKLSLCMTVDSTGALGEFILQSVINNIDSGAVTNYLKQSIQAAQATMKKDNKANESIVSMYELYPAVVSLVKTIEDQWIENILIESVEELFKDENVYYKNINQCMDDFDLSLRLIADNYKKYHASCTEIPQQLIPFKQVVDLFNQYAISFNASHIDGIHKDWYKNNWACLKYDIELGDSIEINRKILLRGLYDLFSKKIAHINLPQEWLEEVIVKPFLSDDISYIKWTELKEILFEDIIHSDCLEKKIVELIAADKINEAILIGKHWKDFMPNKNELKNCFIKAIKNTSVSLPSRNGKFILSSNKNFGILAKFEINVIPQKWQANNIKYNLENLKIETKIGDLTLENVHGIELELLSITTESFVINETLERRDQKFRLKFKYSKTASITNTDNSAVYGFSGSYSGIGVSASLPSSSKSIGVNTNTKGFLYIDCDFPIYIQNDKVYIDMYMSDFNTITYAELLTRKIDIKHHQLQIKRQ